VLPRGLRYAIAAGLIAAMWLRLESPLSVARVAAMVALGAVPLVVPGRLRLPALGLSALGALALAVHLSPHRFWRGFLDFYGVQAPFAPGAHAPMRGVLELAVYGFAAAAGIALAYRRPGLAALALLVGAGWPATLLSGPGEAFRGALILAGVLAVLLERAPRAAIATGAAIVLASVAASTSPALARNELLAWQNWDLRSLPRTVDVAFAWNASYTGIHFPTRATTVFTATGPPASRYWRAATLDVFDADRWSERLLPLVRRTSRVDFSREALEPPQARNRSTWIPQKVTVAALADAHLVGAGEPVAFDTSGAAPIEYAGGGRAMVAGTMRHGDRYTVWSLPADPAPVALARSRPAYPESLLAAGYLDFQGGARFPVFGSPRRRARMLAVAGPYAGMAAQAERVAGGAPGPYAAAVALEGWFRRSGGFRYDEHPPVVPGVPPLVAFTLQTKRGYCQHFAGAMALMLRMLGVPARVAVGFTSGAYNAKKGVWTVTDRDAHAWVEAWFAGYGWLPFDPTPGRGELAASYSASSSRFDARSLLGARAGIGGPTPFEARLDRLTALPGGPGGSGTAVGAAPAPGRPSLLRLLLLIAAGVVAAIALLKVGIRRSRYLSRDPRRVAAACRLELADILRDQGVDVPRSATAAELAALLDRWPGADSAPFVAAVERARFGRADGAEEAAVEARAELRRLKRDLRRRVGAVPRLRGLLSLRSLGLSG
jgi:transglutaminase-like putative cysteine protease